MRLMSLLLLLGLCAILTRAGQNETPPQKSPARYTVDGIALGMTEREVRERWGEVQAISLLDGTSILSKSRGDEPFHPTVMLDKDRKVASVSGSKLRMRSKAILARGCRYREQALGGRLLTGSSPVGSPWQFSRYSVDAEGGRVDVTGIEGGRVLAVFLSSRS